MKDQHPLRKLIEEINRFTDEEVDYILTHFRSVIRPKHHIIVQVGEQVNQDFRE